MHFCLYLLKVGINYILDDNGTSVYILPERYEFLDRTLHNKLIIFALSIERTSEKDKSPVANACWRPCACVYMCVCVRVKLLADN